MSGLTVDFSFVKPRDTWFLVNQSAEGRGEGASAAPTSPTGKHAPDTPAPPQRAAEASEGTVLASAGRLVAQVGAGGRGGRGCQPRESPGLNREDSTEVGAPCRMPPSDPALTLR